MYKRHFIAVLILTNILFSQKFNIARIQYSGGGDWYSDPSSLPNLLDYLRTYTPMKKAGKEVRIKLTDSDAKHFPYLYLTGHGNINFSEDATVLEVLMIYTFLHSFLY